MKANHCKNKNSTRSKNSKTRRQKFLRKLKFYSSAAGLGAFACSSTAQGAIVFYDVTDVTITNNATGISQFIDIHADGPSNPDGSPPEWQIMGQAASFNQIRIDTTFTSGVPGDERPDHSDIGPTPIPAPSTPLVGQGNQLLSLFGNPGSSAPTDPFPGYYVESVPFGFSISRATMSPSFYVGLAARSLPPGFPPIYNYNRIGTNRFVGLEWAFEGPSSTNRRYGWAQINVTPIIGQPLDFYSATLTAYAFEMTPNTPITTTPEPSSLALLAAGGGGFALIRRRLRRRQT